MAEVLGGIAAGLQIAQGLTQLCRKLHRCIKTIQNAPDDIRSFQTEIDLFTNSLSMFHTVASNAMSDLDAGSEEIVQIDKSIKMLMEQSQKVDKGTRKLLVFVRQYTGSLKSKWEWLWKQRSLAVLMAVINTVKLNLNVVQGNLMIHVLCKKIRMLERENKEIPATLRENM
jgi:hypothetical protein